jgi:histidinol-phosphate aminotransferase
MSYFRRSVDEMSAYQPGEQPQQPGFVKLNTNENPYPPSPKVLEALREQVGPSLRLYPDPLANRFREAVAKVLDFPVDWIMAGNGSDDLLTIVTRAFVGEGERVVYPVPTYSLYRTLAQLQGAQSVEIPFPADYGLPQRLAEASGQLTLLANPNSPSGTWVPPAAVEGLASKCRNVLVVDEAYVDFAEGSCLDVVRRRRNVIVLRTLSKSFSLCAMRIGFAVAHPEIIEGMMKVKDSYNVNRLAIFAGAAAMEDIAWTRRNADKIKATRTRTIETLSRLGFSCWPSQSNFVLARATQGISARSIYEKLKQRKILVRYFDQPRVDDCLRISVGTDEEMDKLFMALRDVLAV